MFSDYVINNAVHCVVNGCRDCICMIGGVDNYCFLLGTKFTRNDLQKLGIKRLYNCPLPQIISVSVKAHSYSDFLKEGE